MRALIVSLLLVVATCAGAQRVMASQSAASARAPEPGYQCDLKSNGDFGAISAHFDVPKSGAAPRGSVRWTAPGNASPPLLISAEWTLDDAGHFRLDKGNARITAPLPPAAEESFYVGLYVRANPNSKFANPTVLNKSMLDDRGGGGFVHSLGDNLYFYNVGWRDLIDFGKRYPQFYLFGVRDMALNRPVILARFAVDPAPLFRAERPVELALDKVERMIADPARFCPAVDDLPPPPIVIVERLVS